MASVYNPIDNIVYKRSNNWTPEKKPQEQEWMTFRNPLEHPDIKALPPLKLRKSGKRLDLIQMRRERRNRLLNIKASQIERELKDGVEKNEAEMLYEKQMAELEKLKAQMGKGILAFFVDYTANKAQEQFRDRFLETDPDIALFDQQSADYIKSVQEVADIQRQNDEREKALRRERQDIRQLLIQQIAEARNEAELEELSQASHLVEGDIPTPELTFVDEDDEEEVYSQYAGMGAGIEPPVSVAETEATMLEEPIAGVKRKEMERKEFYENLESQHKRAKEVAEGKREQALFLRPAFQASQRNVKQYWIDNPDKKPKSTERLYRVVYRKDPYKNKADLDQAIVDIVNYEESQGIVGRKVD